MLTADGRGALIRGDGGIAWQYRAEAGALTLEPSVWIDGTGRARATQALVVSGETPPDGASIGWSLRKVR